MSPSKTQNRKLQTLLMHKRKQLLSDVKKSMGRNLNEDIRLAFELCQDNPDKSVEELLRHVDAAVIGNKTSELEKIDAALFRLKDGTYGKCEECGCEIPVKRLEVLPCATRCVTCQQIVDRLQVPGYAESEYTAHDDHGGNDIEED